MDPDRPTFARRLAVVAAALVALLVLAVVAAVVLLDSETVARRAVALVMPKVSAALGREAALASARLELFPETRVSLSGLRIAGRPGEPPLVELEALRLHVALWPLLRSLGKDVEVESIVLVRPVVALVKARDGTWSWEGLGPSAGPPSGVPAPAAPAAAPSGGGGAAPSVAIRSFRIEKASIRVIDRSAGSDDAGLALSELDLRATGVGPGLPLDASLDAALAGRTQNVHARLSVARVPSGLPATAAAWPSVQGELTLGPIALERFRALFPSDLGAIVRGGSAKLAARLVTQGSAGAPAYRLEGDGSLDGVKLRGQSASGRFRATAAWSPGRPAHSRVDVTDLALRGPGLDLGGNASLETEPVRAWFVLTGSQLDLDAIMGVLPESPAAAPAPTATPAPPAGAPAPASDELLPASTRKDLSAAAARGQVALAEVRSGSLVLTDVKAKVALAAGVLTLETLDAAAYGGRISGGGTRVNLAPREPTWKLAARMDGLDVAKALTAFSPGKPSPVEGELDGTIGLDGAGVDWARVRDRLEGTVALSMPKGALTTTDLGDEVLGGLSKALAAMGKAGRAEKVAGAKGGRTEWKDLSAEFDVKDGWMRTRKPVAFGSGAGAVSLGGRLGLDGRLDLDGKVAVPKAALGSSAAGLPLPATLEVPVALTGTLGKPSVGVRAGDALSGAAKAHAGELEKAGKKTLKDVLRKLGK